MAVVAVPFIHFDLECEAGDVLPDDHPLIAEAPHLFEVHEAPTRKHKNKEA